MEHRLILLQASVEFVPVTNSNNLDRRRWIIHLITTGKTPIALSRAMMWYAIINRISYQGGGYVLAIHYSQWDSSPRRYSDSDEKQVQQYSRNFASDTPVHQNI